MLLHAVFSGPRPRADALIALLNSSGMPAAVDRDREGRPNTRFHALAAPEPIINWTDDTAEPELDDDGNERLMPPVLVNDDDGAPVWDNDLNNELEIETLVDEQHLDDSIELAGRYGYRLRMHGPSGFASLRQADAVAAAVVLPSRHPLLAVFETDPQLLAEFRRVLAQAQS